MRRSWLAMIFTTRAAALVCLVVVLALTLPPQTEDMLVGIRESVTGRIAFNVCMLLLCFNLWYWARAALSAWFEISDTNEAREERVKQAGDRERGMVSAMPLHWLPRIYAGAAGLAGVIAALRSDQWIEAVILVLLLAAGCVLLRYRLQMPRLLGQTISATAQEPPGWASGIFRDFWKTARALLNYAPWGRYWSAAGLLFATACFLDGAVGLFFPGGALWSFLPTFLNRSVPGPSMALLFLGFITGPLTFLTYIFDQSEWGWTIVKIPFRLKYFPILTVLAALTCITPVVIDLHAVRIAEPDKDGLRMPASERASLQAFTEAWLARCAPDTGKPVRPIIVAVSGGASRAGLWGMRVLMAVDEEVAQARTKTKPGNSAIFAVSSVSGGSVGAAAYLAMRKKDGNPGCSLSGGLSPAKLEKRDYAIVDGLRRDALGPLLRGALFGDTPRALFGMLALPFGDHQLLRGQDRAEALERAFEKNWAVSIRALNRLKLNAVPFDESYLGLYYTSRKQAGGTDMPAYLKLNLAGAGLPLWLGNGTDSQGGGRLLTSAVPIESDVFMGAKDVIGLLQTDIPISTAIDNTARFPYLSPDGELLPLSDVRRQKPTHIIDGGYFENEGMLTALELARWLRAYGARNNRTIDPILVEATADADKGVLDSRIVRCGPQFQDDPVRSDGGDRPSQLFAPLFGLYSVRGGHASVALRQARMEFCGRAIDPKKDFDQSFFHFYLYRPDGEDVPLNWVLSEHIAEYIWWGALHNGANDGELRALRSVLGSKP